MECDRCGRYLPSAEVLPVLDRDGALVMACARCRRPDPDRPAEAPLPTVHLANAHELPAVGLAR